MNADTRFKVVFKLIDMVREQQGWDQRSTSAEIKNSSCSAITLWPGVVTHSEALYDGYDVLARRTALHGDDG